MELSPRQRTALTSICDTFFPADNGVPSASELGVVDALLAAVAANPRAAERRQLARLLGLWDTPLLTALGGGGLRRFSALGQAERERVLLSWCDSRLPQRRAAFQALRKGALLVSYMLANPDGSPNPVWEAMGFPGPLGKKADAPPKPLKPLEIAADTDLSCDVVVVGSGAGGGTAAGVLAAAGLDVVVLEMGGYYDDADFDGSEVTALTGLYLGAPQASHDQSVGLLAGSCLGGGTVVNYSTSFRTPDEVREEWAGHGVPAFATQEYTQSLDAVVERLGVNLEHNKPSRRDEILRAGCDALGWHIDAMPRNVRGCDQGKECGYCGLGCRIGAKQSVTKTWLADAASAGARFVVNTRAERVIIESGAARGVEARTLDGHRVTVRSRAVVAACGALHTPALLRRSGLDNANIGKHLKLHPVAVVMATYEDEVRPWEGVMQALYSDQHRDLDNGYGVKYETGPTQPHLALAFVPWRGGRAHRELMEALPFSLADSRPRPRPRRRGGPRRARRPARGPLPPVRLRPRSPAHRPRRRRADPRGGRREANLLEPQPLGRVRARPRRRPGAVHGRLRRRRLRARPVHAGLLPHHGLGAHGRLPRELGLRPNRPDLGRARPRGLRRLGLPDGLGREPDGLDRGDRTHERARARGAAALGPARPTTAMKGGEHGRARARSAPTAPGR